MAGAYIFAPAGPDLTPDEAAFFREADPWAFILFARNVDTPDRLRRLTSDLRAAIGRDALILTDQEGGRVQRLRAPHWIEWKPPLEDAKYGPTALSARYRTIAAELRAVGIDGNCAPCADIAGPDTHRFLQNRCLGTDAAIVTQNARAVAEAHLAAGVLPVIKHMPGHGRATTDSHHAIPRTNADRDTLDQTDFAPFRALNHLPLGMTGHVAYTALEEGPATTSKTLLTLIREDLGFQGFLMTDDISMNALSGTVTDRSTAALSAGCDAVLHCNGDLAEMQAIATATRPLTPQAETRANAALARRKPDPGLDAQACLSDYARLINGGVDA